MKHKYKYEEVEEAKQRIKNIINSLSIGVERNYDGQDKMFLLKDKNALEIIMSEYNAINELYDDLEDDLICFQKAMEDFCNWLIKNLKESNTDFEKFTEKEIYKLYQQSKEKESEDFE
jgi:hypothetical protein